MSIKQAVDSIISYIGDDVDRSDLKHTVKSFTETLDTLLNGYRVEDVSTVFSTIITNDGPYGQIILKDIDMFSVCEHHLLPFFGTVDISYIPNKKIAGIGDFANLVSILSRRLQIQERLTLQIGQEIDKCLMPNGVAVRMRAKHLCAKVTTGYVSDVVTHYFNGVLSSGNGVFFG